MYAPTGLKTKDPSARVRFCFAAFFSSRTTTTSKLLALK